MKRNILFTTCRAFLNRNRVFTKDVIQFIGYLSECLSLYFIGLISFYYWPFDIDWRVLFALFSILYLSRYAAVTGVLAVVSRLFPFLPDFLEMKEVVSLMVCDYRDLSCMGSIEVFECLSRLLKPMVN